MAGKEREPTGHRDELLAIAHFEVLALVETSALMAPSHYLHHLGIWI